MKQISSTLDLSPTDGRIREVRHTSAVVTISAHRIEAALRALVSPLPLTGRLLDAAVLLYEVEEILRTDPMERSPRLTELRQDHVIALLECMRAFSALSGANISEAAMNRVALAVTKDSLTPNPGKSPGRDALFELFLFGILGTAGLVPFLIPEGSSQTADIQAALNSFPFVVEAKRVTVGQTEKLVRKACKQIRAQNLPGIIALDLTYELALSERASPKIPYDNGPGRFLRFANLRAEKITTDVTRWIGNAPVFGLLMFAQTVFLDRSTGKLNANNYSACKQLPFGAKTPMEQSRFEIGKRIGQAQNLHSQRMIDLINGQST